MSKKKDLEKMVKIQKATIKILTANLEAFDKKVKELERENQSLRERLKETGGFNFMKNVWDKE
jgi:predicted RNase H-like nuclease (RuvC/YqgF family)|tara:strand:+ start:1202 stop:1390 length:189 start_codon:yes stop_codon:yes gene_type:complete